MRVGALGALLMRDIHPVRIQSLRWRTSEGVTKRFQCARRHHMAFGTITQRHFRGRRRHNAPKVLVPFGGADSRNSWLNRVYSLDLSSTYIGSEPQFLEQNSVHPRLASQPRSAPLVQSDPSTTKYVTISATQYVASGDKGLDSIQARQLADSLEGKTVGGWLIKGFFGNGKSAVVLPATKNGVEAAIKIFHPELIERYGKPAQLERIHREKSLIGAEHPNLVRIFDGGECSVTGQLYVVMEPITFPNLQKTLNSLPPDAVPSLISQVASAARFLEDRGLAHRDIKPENIAVADDFSRAILLDLGVLRPIGLSNLTDVDQRSFIGTLRYSSPEFLSRKEQDTTEGWRAVTFYQLGAVLHDMLMKRPLFDEYSEPFSGLVEAVKSVIPKIHAEDARHVALANHCLIKNPTTRLELVSWADFSDGSAPENSSAVAARDRIRQRQKYFQASAAGTYVPALETRRIARQALDEVCNRFESRIAALMNDLQCFPLRATRSERDVTHKRCTTCVYFERDDEKGLPVKLSLVFEISIIDENQGQPICKAAASAALSHGEITPAQAKPTKHFFAGEVRALLDSQSLEHQFVDALERAYSTLDQGLLPPVDGILRLTEA